VLGRIQREHVLGIGFVGRQSDQMVWQSFEMRQSEKNEAGIK
jgi:hypothetical protein